MTGRPLFHIDWDKVDSMCAIQCTGEEIAGVLGCSFDTLSRAVEREKSCSFAEFFAQKKSAGKPSLRRAQYLTAIEGNATMQIWLGKNWLGQTDKRDYIIDHNITAFEVIEDDS